jgi:NitT/TauT family transport system substrate-binding protein
VCGKGGKRARIGEFNTMIGVARRIAALAAVLGAMAAGPATAAPFKLIISDLATPLVPNSVMDLAKSLGYFDREGVDVELVRVQQTPSAVAALQAGEGDMANIAVDATIQLVARKQIALKAVTSPNKSLPYLIAAKSVIASVPGLAGHSFGVGRIGSLDHSLSLNVLKTLGADPGKVDFVSLGQPDVRAKALAAGQIDATTVSIGVWLSLPDKGGLHVLVDPDDYYAAAPVVNKVNVVTDKVLQDKRDQVIAVTRALVRISRDFAAAPAKWVDAMAKARSDVAKADLQTLADNFKESWSINGGLSKSELAYTSDWLYATPDFKDLPKVPLSDWVDFSVLDAILAKDGTAPGFDAPTR